MEPLWVLYLDNGEPSGKLEYFLEALAKAVALRVSRGLEFGLEKCTGRPANGTTRFSH